MKTSGLTFLLLILLVGANGILESETSDHDKVVACYVASWAIYRTEAGAFSLDNLRPQYCTHLIYAFAGLDATSWTIRSLDPYLDIEKGNYKKVTSFRRQYPDLKVTLAIGGWNEGGRNYSALASSAERRKTFIASVIDFLRRFDFDGLDLDWEFPVTRDGVPNDRENFVALIQELRAAFGSRYILTAAISASIPTINVAYDIPKISKYLDYIHIMSYDYHGTWDKQVLPNSPLRSQDRQSVEDTVTHLLLKGAPANKLVLGLPMYGRTFILTKKPKSPIESPIGLPSLDQGFAGPYTKENGFMGYNEICEDITKHPEMWRLGWDDYSSTPYAINDDRVIVYDNPKGMIAKINYVLKLNLSGVMVWSIDTDDFYGKCGVLNEDILDPLIGVDFPLMRSINKALLRKNSAERICFNIILVMSTTLVFFYS